MTLFFIRTDSSAAGPFTGVELREAAFAGILAPESELAATRDGPWVDAAKTGLFSENRLPLPHPPEVRVPQFHVRGMAGAVRGPFKLRELIGFAARGMLPRDSLFQSDPDQPWIPMDRLRVLLACVTGELTLLDPQGQVVLRVIKSGTPLTGAGQADRSTPLQDEKRSWDPKPIANAVATSRSLILRFTPAPKGLLQNMTNLRQLMIIAGVGLLIASTAYGISYWQRIPVQKQAIVGDWIGGLGADGLVSENVFGLKFRENGECVFFNPKDSSWSGDYDWVERRDDNAGHVRMQPLHVVVDTPEPGHKVEEIRASDGYLRLSGIGGSQPRLDGHAVSDLFVRTHGKAVRLGYLIEVTASEHGKTMKAAWVELTMANPTLFAADAASSPQVTAESMATTPVEMLLAFGVPDEARNLFPFEARRENLRNQDATAIRYGERRIIIRPHED